MFAAAVNSAILRQLESAFAGPITSRRVSSPASSRAGSRLLLEDIALAPRTLHGQPAETVLSGTIASLSIETCLPWNPLSIGSARVLLAARGVALTLRVSGRRDDFAEVRPSTEDTEVEVRR